MTVALRQRSVYAPLRSPSVPQQPESVASAPRAPSLGSAGGTAAGTAARQHVLFPYVARAAYRHTAFYGMLGRRNLALAALLFQSRLQIRRFTIVSDAGRTVVLNLSARCLFADASGFSEGRPPSALAGNGMPPLPGDLLFLRAVAGTRRVQTNAQSISNRLRTPFPRRNRVPPHCNGC